MNGAKTIIKKELYRVFSDKKLIFSLFILPAVIVIGIYALMGQMINMMVDDQEAHTAVVYIQNLPEGVDGLDVYKEYAATAQITVIDAAADTTEIKADILNGDADLLVVFDKDFIEKTTSYSKQGDAVAGVELFYNTTGNYSSLAASNFSSTVLAGLQGQILYNRFGNMELLNAFNISETYIVNEDKANGEFLAMLLPYFITMMLFAGAMSLGVDAIAGEKERGTMASMLLTPIKRSEIVMGKLVSLGILSGISAIVYAVAMIVAMPLMSGVFGSDTSSLTNVHFNALQVVELIVIMLVMVYLYVALIALVSVLAKSVKEAGTYVSPLYILVIAGGLITMYQGGMEKSLQSFAIPIYGNALAIQNIMTNELTLAQFGMSVGGTLVLALLLTAGLTKAFNSEKIMFNA